MALLGEGPFVNSTRRACAQDDLFFRGRWTGSPLRRGELRHPRRSSAASGSKDAGKRNAGAPFDLPVPTSRCSSAGSNEARRTHPHEGVILRPGGHLSDNKGLRHTLLRLRRPAVAPAEEITSMSHRDHHETLLGRKRLRLLVALLAGSTAFLLPVKSLAFWNVEVGDTVPDRQLLTLDGSRQSLLGHGQATVFVLCRPQHDRSLQTLRELAQLERAFAGKPVRFVAVTPDSYDPKAVRSMMRQAGVRMEVLVDKDDALAGALGVDTRPAVAVADEAHHLAAYQHYLSVNMGATLQLQIQDVLDRQRGLAGREPSKRPSDDRARTAVASSAR